MVDYTHDTHCFWYLLASYHVECTYTHSHTHTLDVKYKIGRSQVYDVPIYYKSINNGKMVLCVFRVCYGVCVCT
jgi:hypothetical protein